MISPDDLEDLKEQSMELVEVLGELELQKHFTDNVIGSTFYKVAAAHALKAHISLEKFLELGVHYYCSLESLIESSNNQKFEEPKKGTENA